ncbi:hypothetical protein I79_026186 [Cricetulus griseus]|uniref:Uncharacterized protein n=1 Tax=Cricetulus griseus TaxID=10029 RepID=G3IQ84_CRIGR|nr:hypothetical protein I79_026186 [Cricetulus griseus]
MKKKLNSVVAFYAIVPQHQSCHLEHGLPGQAEDYKKGEDVFQNTVETKPLVWAPFPDFQMFKDTNRLG